MIQSDRNVLSEGEAFMEQETRSNILHLPLRQARNDIKAVTAAPERQAQPDDTTEKLYAVAVSALSDYHRLAKIPQLTSVEAAHLDVAREMIVQYLCLGRALALAENNAASSAPNGG